jgi:hypothetical protein
MSRDTKEMIAYKAPKILGWIYAEKEALAANLGVPAFRIRARNNGPFKMPDCYNAPAYNGGSNWRDGCMRCGAGTGHLCASVYACPSIFPQCTAFNGTSANAVFAQDFMISPPCTDTTGKTCY